MLLLHLLGVAMVVFILTARALMKTADELRSELLQDVVASRCVLSPQLPASNKEALLIRRTSRTALDILVHVSDGFRRFSMEGDGPAG